MHLHPWKANCNQTRLWKAPLIPSRKQMTLHNFPQPSLNSRKVNLSQRCSWSFWSIVKPSHWESCLPRRLVFVNTASHPKRLVSSLLNTFICSLLLLHICQIVGWNLFEGTVWHDWGFSECFLIPPPPLRSCNTSIYLHSFIIAPLQMTT